MTDFFAEIYSEEIPSRMQKKAVADFAKIASEAFEKNGINFSQNNLKTFISPRRLSLCLSAINSVQEIAEVVKFGPQITANQKAIDGFLNSNNLTSVDQLEISEQKGNKCYLYRQPKSEIKTIDILAKILPDILQKMTNSWPKLMRFDIENSDFQPKWIRPIRNISAMFGNDVVNFEFAGLKTSNITFALDNSKITLNRAIDYREYLDENNIILDQDIRKNLIISRIENLCEELSLTTMDNKESSNLFDEVTGLCQYPTALVGEIDERFLALPNEVLFLTLKNNQKYFCLKDKEQNFSNKFIFVVNNIISDSNEEKIIKDTEKLVRARLSDAEFFINEDLNKPLSQRTKELEKVIFHQKLGSIQDKILRLQNLAKFIGVFVPRSDFSLIEKSVNLIKSDLTTKAVAELPELQGRIGEFYATKQGENPKIAKAIYEHYLPVGPNSPLPQSPLGITLSISDKIDSIVGFFLCNEKPTSSKDPFGLRRYTLAIIRIVFEFDIAFPIRISVEKSLNTYSSKLLKEFLHKEDSKFIDNKKKLIEEIITFFVERLKSYLKEDQNLKTEIINVVIDEYLSNLNSHRYCNILYLAKKIKFLDSYIKNDDNEEILNLYKRSANILAIEEKKDKKRYNGKVSRLHLKDKNEKILYASIKKVSAKHKKLVVKGSFEEAFFILKIIEKPLTNFFDNVLINQDDKGLRENRLKLLNKVVSLFNITADISKING